MKNQILLLLAAISVLMSACDPAKTRNAGKDANIEFQPCWNTIGSAGSVDESSINAVVLGRVNELLLPPNTDPLPIDNFTIHDAVASLAPSVSTGAATIRYNIDQFMGLPGYQPKSLRVRYLVTDKAKQRLLVFLKRYSISSPPSPEKVEILAIFDSNKFGSSPNYQTREITMNSDKVLANYFEYAYYLEAQLVRVDQAGQGPQIPQAHKAPAVAAISICDMSNID
ncbi:MAG: hypothetical protein IPN33_20595 [Saprospiraceae bacterium]|nr:hypothetical protein [Saprospiraceae bacterium]